MMEAICQKFDYEDYYAYALRLYKNKGLYQLSWMQICDLLNSNFNMNKTESAYRKFLTAFSKGMEYQRNLIIENSNVAVRILCLSDFHFPFQLPIETFSMYRSKVDILVLNGDLLDLQSVSKFIKTFRINFMDELIQAREYFIKLINYISPKKVLVIYGNHEARLGAYLAKNLDSEVNQLLPDNALDLLFDTGFNYYNKQDRIRIFYEPIKNVCTDINIVNTNDWKCRIGKTIFAHPLAFSSSALKTVDKAVEYFHDTEKEIFDCVVLAHTHHRGNAPKGYIEMYEQGCCCDISKLHYRDGKFGIPQQKGFVYLCQDKDGNIIKDSTKLIKLD